MSHWSTMFTGDSLIRHIWSRLPGAAAAAESPAGKQEEKESALELQGLARLLRSPGGRGDINSRKNTLGSFPPSCWHSCLRVPLECPVQSLLSTTGISCPPSQGGGGVREGERAGCVWCDKLYSLLTFNYLNPCCFIPISSVGPSLLSSSSRNLCNLNIYKTDPSKKRESFVFYFILCSNWWDHAQTILKSVCNSLTQLFIIWA